MASRGRDIEHRQPHANKETVEEKLLVISLFLIKMIAELEKTLRTSTQNKDHAQTTHTIRATTNDLFA